MTTTIGSLDLGALSDLREDVTQYFWFESNSSSAWGSGAHVTLYPESQFTDPNNANYLKGQNILMNTDGFSIRNGALPMMVLDNNSLDFNIIDTTNNIYTNQASFGAVSTIGVTDNTQSYIQLDFHSLQMIDKEGNTYFYVSDLRDVEGNILEQFNGDGNTTIFNVSYPIQYVAEVLIDDVPTTEYTRNGQQFTFTVAPSSGSIITIKYMPTNEEDSWSKAYTLGIRGVGAIGMGSYVEGQSDVASGIISHAEGYTTIAQGDYSHAEGAFTQAQGSSSHAEGYGCISRASASHAEGDHTEAQGESSHSQNISTIASMKAQTVIGSKNVIDTKPTTPVFPGGSQFDDEYGNYALIIGNGHGQTRSNALTVDWQGGVAFYDPSKTFVVTTETFSYSAISNGSGSGVRTATFSKSGYYPVGVMGFRTGNSAAVPTRLNLSSRSSGSAELSYVLRAVAAVSAGSGDVDILWIKIT